MVESKSGEDIDPHRTINKGLSNVETSTSQEQTNQITSTLCDEEENKQYSMVSSTEEIEDSTPHNINSKDVMA